MKSTGQIIILSILIIICGCKTPSIIVTQEQQKGDASFNQHDYPSALQHYGAMLEASSKLGIYRNLSMEADVHRKMANAYEMSGRYQEALIHVKSARELDSLENNPIEFIEDIQQEGLIHLYTGDFNQGIQILKECLILNEGMDESLKNTNRLSIARTHLALGRAESALGRFNEARDNLQKSLNLFESAGSKEGMMESWLFTGRLYIDLGHTEEARSCLEKSRSIAESLDMSTARHAQGLALIESSLGFYENGLKYQGEALKQAKEYNIAGQLIWYTIGMGDIYRDIGDLERALRHYREAEILRDSISGISRSMDASIGLRTGGLSDAFEYYTDEAVLVGAGIAALRLGEIYAMKEQQDSALIYYFKAGELFQESGNRMGFAQAKMHQGAMLVDLDKPDQAMIALDSAEMDAIGPDSFTATGTYPEILWQVWFHRGRLHEKMNSPEQARTAYEESIRIIESIRGNLSIDEFKSRYLDNKREVYENLIKLLIQMDEPLEAFSLSERAKARTFLDKVANRKIDFRDAADNGLIRLEQDMSFQIQNLYKLLQKNQLAQASGTGSRQGDTRRIWEELHDAQENYEDLLIHLKLEEPDYSQMINFEPFPPEEIHRSLNENTAIISYWIGEESLNLWFISQQNNKYRQVDIGRQELENLIERTRRRIGSNNVTGARENLNELYHYLIQPIEAELLSFSDLIIIPNGALHFLPYPSLLTNENKFLVQNFTISYSPSASIHVLGMNQKYVPGNSLLGMALGDLSIGYFEGLPGTGEELNKIGLEFSGQHTAFIAGESTETRFKSECSKYPFIHLATHGLYNYQQPLYSFLLFNPSGEDDGRLTVHEVFELDLKCNLVTLSACETGLGNMSQGDELEGLSRAFIYAGTSSVVVSLWSVADYQTSLLMTNFYSYLKDHPAREALTLAQRKLMDQYPNPFFWAPFILIGNGNYSIE